MRPQPESTKALLQLLKQDPIPTKLEITALPIDETIQVEGEQVSSETNLTNNFLKADIHLGINATKLPRLARDFRKDYASLRSIFVQSQQHMPTGGTQDLFSLNQRLIDSTTCLLMLCPDHATAWSDRKRGLLLSKSWSDIDDDLIKDSQSVWNKEISFLDMLFSQHSKAPNAWSHRKWICDQIVANIKILPPDKTRVLVSSHTWRDLIHWARHEIEQCIRVAEHYPKNYYAWTHRSFIIRTLINLQTTDTPHNSDNASNDLLLNLLQEEVNSIHPWLRRHVSDHSAAHYGGEVLRLLLRFGESGLKTNEDKISWKIKLIQEQLVESRRLALFFRSYEVLWIWKRICSQIFLGTLAELSSHNTSSNSKSILTHAIHQFVDIDVNQTLEDCYCVMPSIAEDESQCCILYCNTYVMWVLEHFKRQDSYKLIENDYYLEELEAKVSASLATNDRISHNMWRNRVS